MIKEIGIQNRLLNPIIPGFYPDPSLCRVGEDYYLVTSSFEYFPGIPVFHSRDLIHWRQIGYGLTRPSQLPLQGACCSGGIFAPTIRYRSGMFYITAKNNTVGKNFLVTTDDPAGEWSEPIWLEQSGGDPSLFWDDDGRVYLTTDGTRLAEIDLETGRRLTDEKMIWDGSGGKDVEGPHLYKIGEMYYLLTAEGGTDYGHMETLARAPSLHGPWEGCPHNPIMSNRSINRPIQAAGHAELFQAHDESWWVVFLGTRPVGHYPPSTHLGRETCLAPVSWNNEGWLAVNGDGTIGLEIKNHHLPLHLWPAEPVRDDFDTDQLQFCWNFLRNPNIENWSLTQRPGWLCLNGSGITLNDEDSPAFVGRRQCHLNCEAETRIDFEPKEAGQEAGLTILSDALHHYEIFITKQDGQRHVMVRRRIGNLVVVEAMVPLGRGVVKLGIQAESCGYSFFYALEDEPMKLLGKGETRYLAAETAGGFTGVYFGLYATGNGTPCGSSAYFDWFDYRVVT